VHSLAGGKCWLALSMPVQGVHLLREEALVFPSNSRIARFRITYRLRPTQKMKPHHESVAATSESFFFLSFFLSSDSPFEIFDAFHLGCELLS